MKETSKKIHVSQDSFFDTYPHNPSLLNQQQFIKAVFINYGIIPSQIYIAEHTHLYTIQFKLFYFKPGQHKLIKPLLNFIRPLLVIKYNKNVVFNIKLSPHLYADDTQLAT
jgi:hypothetical protein